MSEESMVQRIGRELHEVMKREHLSDEDILDMLKTSGVEIAHTTFARVLNGTHMVGNQRFYEALVALDVGSARGAVEALKESTPTEQSEAQAQPTDEEKRPRHGSNANQTALQWKAALKTALHTWCSHNGWIPATKLQERLDIAPREKWSRIYNGDVIAGEADRVFYARIYHFTGLKEADPRTIPPRYIKIPRGGGMFQGRNWSEGEWRKWLEKEGTKYAPPDETRQVQRSPIKASAPIAPPEPVTIPIPDGQNQSPPFAQMLSQLITAYEQVHMHPLNERMDQIERQLREMKNDMNMPPTAPDTDHLTITQMANALREQLEELSTLSPRERDIRITDSQRKALVNLFPLVEAYSLQRSQREEAIQFTQLKSAKEEDN